VTSSITTVYRGQTDVALWTKARSPSVVSNWFRRFPKDVPAPDAEIVNTGSPFPLRGYLPGREPEWAAFAARLPARDTPSLTPAKAAARNARRTADQIYADMEAGDIKPHIAARLLRELIGAPDKEGPTP
jgi:hypothetical protein